MRPTLKSTLTLLSAVAVMGLSATAAEARDHHRGHGRGHGYHHGHHWKRDRSHSSFSLHIGIPAHTYYQPTYYAPPAPVYPVYPATYETPPTDDRYCREYTRDAWVGGRMQQTFGTACLQPDGDWEVQS